MERPRDSNELPKSGILSPALCAPSSPNELVDSEDAALPCSSSLGITELGCKRKTNDMHGREPHLWPQIIGPIPKHSGHRLSTNGPLRTQSLPTGVTRRETCDLFEKRQRAKSEQREKISSHVSVASCTKSSPEEPPRRHTFPPSTNPVEPKHSNDVGFIQKAQNAATPTSDKNHGSTHELALEGPIIGAKSGYEGDSSPTRSSLETPNTMPQASSRFLQSTTNGTSEKDQFTIDVTSSPDSACATSRPEARYSEVGMGISQKVNLYRRHSVNSVLDYVRATQWFQGLPRTPESHQAPETEVSDQPQPLKKPTQSDRRLSESTPLENETRSSKSSLS